jgi:hypothetical protein
MKSPRFGGRVAVVYGRRLVQQQRMRQQVPDHLQFRLRGVAANVRRNVTGQFPQRCAKNLQPDLPHIPSASVSAP